MKEKNNVIIFWNKNDAFSNLFQSPFKYRGLTFFSVEQCYLWKLSRLSHDKNLTSKLLKEQNPLEAKKLMRNFKIKPQVINEHKFTFLVDILKAKCDSNDEFKKLLLATENKTIVFASDKDFDMGSGWHYTIPSNFYLKELRGKNIYGQVLMTVRDSILKNLKNIS